MDRGTIFLLAALFASVHALGRKQETLKETMPMYAIIANANLLNASSCRTELEELHRAVDDQVFWALKVLDANGKPPSGFSNGNNFWLGDQQLCNQMKTRSVPPLFSYMVQENRTRYVNLDNEFPPFAVNFYSARFVENSTMKDTLFEDPIERLVVLGLCLPISCTTNDLTVILEKVFRDRTLLVGQLYNTDFKLVEVSDMKNDQQWLLSAKMVLIIFVLTFSLGLVIAGTFYDLLVYQKRLQKKKEFLTFENNNTAELKNDAETKHEPPKHEPTTMSDLGPETYIGQTLMCFSAYSNFKKIIKMESQPKFLTMFHGLKFFGMAWIVMVHTLFYGGFYVGNKSTAFLKTDSFIAQIICNASFSVDTFFFMSGFLLTYIFQRETKKEKSPVSFNLRLKVNQLIMIIIRRFMRLTPAYLITILIVILDFTWIEKVSLYKLKEEDHVTCSNYWWRNLLYINNFFEWDDMCLSWSWYLSNDTQFFIFGSVVLLISITHFYTALVVAVVTMIGSIMATIYTAYDTNISPLMDIQFETLTAMYIRPWIRIGPFLIGMATAHLLEKWNYKLHLSNKALIIGWTFGILCNGSILFGVTQKNISLAWSVAYASLSRTAWGFGIAWLTIACTTNNGGIINKFLSLPFWVPLSKITYTVYLLNPVLIHTIFLLSDYTIFIDVAPIICVFLGLLVISFASGLLLSLVAEMPTILVIRMMFSSNRRMK
ncbi:nose resistant to fluoxetine protein 6 isoform X2 [Ptiloglossa arizonensis]|uniref:nose resistant to fluoxetine protein 6 isoform X2 n=1 Tax=Ptiloglossa arizonensis TaxID=3350558 RepID=UPI003F9F2E7D